MHKLMYIETYPFDTDLRRKAAETLKAYNEAIDDEEKFFAQKAKIDWLKEGDRNNAYFHRCIKGRLQRNKVTSICDEQGMIYEGDDVPKQFVNHFLQFQGNEREIQDIHDPDNLFTKKISTEEAVSMCATISDEEIKVALFGIGDNKALGPDGYTSKFLQKSMACDWKGNI